MAFRGENELWIGTVLSALPETISVTSLAGVCGAMSSDANRAVNAYYGPSEELDTYSPLSFRTSKILPIFNTHLV